MKGSERAGSLGHRGVDAVVARGQWPQRGHGDVAGRGEWGACQTDGGTQRDLEAEEEPARLMVGHKGIWRLKVVVGLFTRKALGEVLVGSACLHRPSRPLGEEGSGALPSRSVCCCKFACLHIS